MNLLDHLNEVNDVTICDVSDPKFLPYGRIVTGFGWTDLIRYMEEQTEIPAEGNRYVASVPEMEALPESSRIRSVLYGGMEIEIGYCNGRNRTYNGFEYHKGSEINVAVTDFLLVLGHTWEITDNHYRNEDAEVFFVPKGSAIEMYQTTLHLSPIRVTDAGFKGIVILPKGTNTPLSEEEKAERDRLVNSGNCPEARLLLQRNKWVISHPERKPLMDQGAFPGIIGENKELLY